MMKPIGIALLACGAVLCVGLTSTAAADSFEEEILDALTVRPIGPANMGGRVTAVAVAEGRPSTIYLATASGGLWKTINRGTSWRPIFEHEATVSLGDVAVAPSNPDIVWVGTGEANPRNSVSWGNGLYRSSDGGKTWKHRGLAESEHIGRVIIHPKNPNIVYAAALGRLWGPNRQRGIFKTTDGGDTWKAVKFIDENTGFIDLVMDPADPNRLYAAAYTCRRGPYAGSNPAIEIGPNAGLYRTVDAGAHWSRLNRGLPERPLGRCGIAVFRKNPRVLYAVVQSDRTDPSVTGQKTRTNSDPASGGIFRSDDGGETWSKRNDLCPRGFYFGQIRVDPSDEGTVYVLGPTLQVSHDGGRTFTEEADRGAHADLHALWIDPGDRDHLLLGSDGGLFVSYDRGSNWQFFNELPIGQFYSVAVDQSRPYRIYGGLQDNGTWGGPSATPEPEGITSADWFRVLGADGFCCQVDPADADTVYAQTQYGGLHRVNVRNGDDRYIQPQSSDEARPYRFNWNAPVLVSPHDAGTLYFGGDYLFRSPDRGEHWQIVGPELTRGRPGRSADSGHTITTIAESPLRQGVLFVGTDDGRLSLTRDGGRSWADISERIPAPRGWFSRIECSRFDENTVYVAIDRHRHNDRAPYLYKTDDGGATWMSLAAGLPPDGSVYVIREDPHNRKLLYAGTEFGLFVSIDSGATWHRLGPLPTVAVPDLVIQPRERELVVATHGRSLYVVDVAPLENLTPRVREADVYLFEIRPALKFIHHGSHGRAATGSFEGRNPPYGAAIDYYLRAAAADAVAISIFDARGGRVTTLKGGQEPGLHRIVWDLRDPRKARGDRPAPLVPAGEYTVRLEVGERAQTRKVQVNAED
jgi:photosystem II stability/assembly factor-like uncharacterized protein